MGKASKLMVNFLLGKKAEKAKKKDMNFLKKNVGNSAAIVPSSWKIWRRWSFGRSSSKEKAHRSEALAVAVERSAGVETVAVTPKQKIDEASRAVICRVVLESAATKIQAFSRSYLVRLMQAFFWFYINVCLLFSVSLKWSFNDIKEARKALNALKGLVKLQALVRGHLVRKQTTATLKRQTHALMDIQVRARFHRIQMAEEFVVTCQSSRNKNISHANVYRRPLRVKPNNMAHTESSRAKISSPKQ